MDLVLGLPASSWPTPAESFHSPYVQTKSATAMRSKELFANGFKGFSTKRSKIKPAKASKTSSVKGLLDLPGEIRNLIYEFYVRLVEHDEQTTVYQECR
jgi:hypothetical protein